MHIFERIRRNYGYNKSQMAERLGITRSNYSNIIHGKQGISREVAIKAYRTFRIPLEQLLMDPWVEDEKTGTEGN